MYIVIFTCALALLLTYLESVGKMKNGMKIGFVLVTILGCIHYNYGNDYPGYYDLYHTIVSTPFSLDSVFAKDIYREPGWVLLNYIFQPIGGFFMLVAVLNIIQNIFVYKFIVQNVKQTWWPLSIFIYLFTTQFYLLNFSMMRQGFVVCVFLGIWKLIEERKIIKSILIVFLCGFIHSSAFVLIPFVFWGYIPTARTKIIAVIYMAVLVVLWFNQDLLLWTFDQFSENENISEKIDFYSEYNTNGTFRIGFFVGQIPALLSVLFLLKRTVQFSNEEMRMVLFSMVALLIQPFGQIVSLSGRLGIYFSIYNLASYPLIYENIENSPIRISLLVLLVLFVLYTYFLFFSTPGWQLHYGTFHTIFEAL